MAVAIFMQWKGVTAAQYDAVKKALAFDTNPPAGGLFHVAAIDESGLTVTDVWDDPALFQAFAEKRLGPAAAAAGVPGQPEVRVLPVHFAFAPALLQGVMRQS